MGLLILLGLVAYVVLEWFVASWLASLIGWTGVFLVAKFRRYVVLLELRDERGDIGVRRMRRGENPEQRADRARRHHQPAFDGQLVGVQQLQALEAECRARACRCIAPARRHGRLPACPSTRRPCDAPRGNKRRHTCGDAVGRPPQGHLSLSPTRRTSANGLPE